MRPAPISISQSSGASALPIDILPGLPATAAAELEDELRGFISTRELPLYRIMSFQLGWVDEHGERRQEATPARLHAQLALAACQAVSVDYRPAVAYAIAVELLHNFWQIHADVEDGNTERDGRPSVWWTWGPAQAINAGDGMHAMARLALFRLTDRGEPTGRVAAALRTLDDATVRLCEGEYLDITYQERLTLSIDSHMDMVSARSGALFGCAARLGVLSVDGGDEACAGMAAFGEKVGIARQIAADYNAFWGRGERDQAQQGRLIAKKKTLPVVHALSEADPTTKRKIGEHYMKRVLDPQSIGEVAHLLETAGSRDFTRQTVTRLAAEAEASAADAGVSGAAADTLREVAKALIEIDE